MSPVTTAKIFISSTGKDLALYRNAAIDVCNKLGLLPIAMEHFEAMGVGASEGSKKKLSDADTYVGIFAHRYGYIEPGYTKSVTEIEFDYAGERKLVRLCFLVDPKIPWPTDAMDFENYQFLESFKSRITGTLIRDQFTSIDDFRAKLMQALVEWKEQQSGHNLPGTTLGGQPRMTGLATPNMSVAPTNQQEQVNSLNVVAVVRPVIIAFLAIIGVSVGGLVSIAFIPSLSNSENVSMAYASLGSITGLFGFFLARLVQKFCEIATNGARVTL